MTPESGKEVFISYSSPRDTGGEGADSMASDQGVAEQVCRRLESEGIDCWIAPRDILPGDSWLEAIIDGVSRCQILVLVFSGNTHRSQWVRDEITLALNRNIKIIPFRIENVSPQGALRILQVRCQWIDAFTPHLEQHLDRLTQAVRTHLARAGKKQSQPEERIETDKKESQRGIPPDLKAVEARAKVNVIKNINGEDLYEADFGDGLIMVYIPPGKFTMGSNEGNESEKPPHDVYLDGYWLGKTEVTFDQYDRFCEETKKTKPPDEGWGRGRRPVINISWHDADAYCKWLSEKIGLEFKLPSEAQWEKAARGSDGREYPWGNDTPSGDKLNFADKQLWLKKKYDWADQDIDDGYAYTAPVGSYPAGASPYGLLDMAGNVWEWCTDWYDKKYYEKSPDRNPPGPSEGAGRVLRGGSWFYDSPDCRAASRDGAPPDHRADSAGVRLFRSL